MNRAWCFVRLFLMMSVFFTLVITACNLPLTPVKKSTTLPPTNIPINQPTEQPTTVSPTVQAHILLPISHTGQAQTIHDQDNKKYANQKRAYGGDEYLKGRFERPFDRNMTYLGYLDIIKSTMIRNDPSFIFVTIQVASPLDSAEENPAYYGLELDLNLDGRNRYLIQGTQPLSEDWTVDGVDVWESTSSEIPLAQSNTGIPVTGTVGFDVSLLKSGKGDDIDLAWIRKSPGLADTIEIAFKNTLVGGEKGKFIWRPFTDGAPFEPLFYDLQTSFSLEQAGSPLIEDANYPLKAVYAVDNTCRVASGYTATGREPGICPQPVPQVEQEEPEQQQVPENPFVLPPPSHR
ncbi:hypothetical protein [Leptolinea tardivitalis]|uniref:Uncharacterized protein n=1 Tax=Leptolinea tardivitalis TaxID=229920 RepID=A0A0P6XHX1_9CHLR|nr:hypothetical protein [Leptolinea tardivitalis]KPL75078.1 hypothetical protein ADM99_00150 [Leptolinea tardivitalis]GAP20457.1 hypothetical protein LTAR_00647 [Leptolinea tardivitalis]